MKRMEYTEEKKAAVEKLIKRFYDSGLNYAEVARGARVAPHSVKLLVCREVVPRWLMVDKINRFYNKLEQKKNGQDSHNKA